MLLQSCGPFDQGSRRICFEASMLLAKRLSCWGFMHKPGDRGSLCAAMLVQGLEAQLLAEVVRREAADLEASKDKLVLSLSADTRQLQELQARILKLLKVSTSLHRA